MPDRHNRRKWERQTLDPPELGYLLSEDLEYKSGTAFIDPPQSLYVDLLNKGQGGAALNIARRIEPDTAVRLLTYNTNEKMCYVCRGKVRWLKPQSDPSCDFRVGLEIKKQEAVRGNIARGAECREFPNSSDFEFFNQTNIFDSIPREALCSLLNSLADMKVKSGERFINQGDPGDFLYIVQQGTCVATVEKEQTIHTVGRMGKGDVVGEMAMLTGEPRSAHVTAETDMQLWGLSRRQFDAIAGENPDLRCFLTELLAERFAGRKLIAERTIGKYIITDIIGHGGYSVVYKGVHSGLNMPVAIKMMRHNLAMEAEFLSTFRKEAKIIANLNHENIIKVYDIEELFRTVFIVMELVEGETIKELIHREQKIPYSQIVHILIQVCQALIYAHHQGIIHRDVKPANMFIKNGDRVKLLDFGLSCTSGSENHDFSGTVAFMSPEEIEGQAVDQRSDIYALGITTYEMLTGKRPFPEDDLLALLNMHLDQDIPDPAEIRPGIPQKLRQLVLKACALKPDQRYQNVQQVLGDLLPLAEELGLVSSSPAREKRSMTTLHLIYEDDQRLALKQLMEEFSTKARKIGVELKAAEFPEI